MADLLPHNNELMPGTIQSIFPDPWEVLMDEVRDLANLKLTAKISPCLGTLNDIQISLEEPCWGVVDGAATWKQQRPTSKEQQHPRANLLISQIALANCIHDVGAPQLMSTELRTQFYFEDRFFQKARRLILAYEYGPRRDSSMRTLRVTEAAAPEEIAWFTTHFTAVRSGDPAQLPKTLLPGPAQRY